VLRWIFVVKVCGSRRWIFRFFDTKPFNRGFGQDEF
jgi:hypothetical protein